MSGQILYSFSLYIIQELTVNLLIVIFNSVFTKCTLKTTLIFYSVLNNMIGKHDKDLNQSQNSPKNIFLGKDKYLNQS